MNRLLPLAIVVALFGLGILTARAVPSGVILAASESLPALSGPIAGAENVTIVCATTATPIQASVAGTGKSIYCENIGSATSVFYGGSDVVAAAPEPCISNTAPTTCRLSALSADVVGGGFFCRVAAGTVSIGCIVGK